MPWRQRHDCCKRAWRTPRRLRVAGLCSQTPVKLRSMMICNSHNVVLTKRIEMIADEEGKPTKPVLDVQRARQKRGDGGMYVQ